MDPQLMTELGVSFASALGSQLKEPAKTLDNLWYLIFGKFNLYVDKKRVQNEADLMDFKNSIAAKVKDIPFNSIKEPDLNIIGPAIEASKFYIESETIREMFAKIISSSMDKRKENQVHSSYVEVVKQLSPLDAQNITILKKDQCPIAEYRIAERNDTIYNTIESNVFLSNLDNMDIDMNAVSITNLSRLGLVSISYVESIADRTRYNKFKHTKTFKNLKETCKIKETINETLDGNERVKDTFVKEISHISGLTSVGIEALLKNSEPQIQKGIVKLTPYGKAFADICC